MKKGFTLIEVIAVLLLVGILVLASTIALLPMVEGFMQASRNVDAAQKSHLAMSRIVREITTITNVVAGSRNTLTYDFLDPSGASLRRTLTWSGDAGAPLTLNGVPISDDVAGFEFRYYTHSGGTATPVWTDESMLIEVVLSTRSGGDTYTNRIRPRNIPKR